jgi:hypothetical protein
MEGDSHKISAAALRSRGLVKTSGRGDQRRAHLTDTGRSYLAHPPDAKRGRQAQARRVARPAGRAHGVDRRRGSRRTRTADDVDHGSYRESKSESPNGDGSFLVDYTVGFNATPRSGATTVRASTSRAAGYDELEFGSWDDGRPRWDFTLSGQRKMYVFTVGCGTGYATLGAASVICFGRLQPMFEQMARSLTPQCE